MSDDNDYRVIANRLIKECTKSGKLDLKLLANRTDGAALEEAKKSAYYSNAASRLETNALKDPIVKRLTIATREVLGLIKEDKWDDKSASFKADHGLVISKWPKGFDYEHPKEIPLNASLRDRGFEFSLSEAIQAPRKAKLIAYADTMLAAVKKATSKDSDAGVVISEEEKESIIKPVIEEYNKQFDALGVTLPDAVKQKIDVMKGLLKKGGVNVALGEDIYLEYGKKDKVLGEVLEDMDFRTNREKIVRSLKPNQR